MWNGVYPAITTKFKPDDSLDFELFGKNLSAQLEAGVEGVILGGTLGEASVLSADEKGELIKFTLDFVKRRVPVIVNIAEGSTREAVKMAMQAEKLGVNGLMMLPPMRYKTDHRETVTFFKTVANSVPLPIMIYNNPIDYKTEVTLDMFAELAEVPTIQAIKESTRDTTNVTRLINRFGDRFKILNGVDTLAIESFVLGAHGWVGGLVCAFPRETVAIYKLVKAGRIQEAVNINRWFLPLCELDIHTKLVQYIKMAEAETGLGSERVRPPRLTLTGHEREQISKIIRQGIATRPQLPEYKNL